MTLLTYVWVCVRGHSPMQARSEKFDRLRTSTCHSTIDWQVSCMRVHRQILRGVQSNPALFLFACVKCTGHIYFLSGLYYASATASSCRMGKSRDAWPRHGGASKDPRALRQMYRLSLTFLSTFLEAVPSSASPYIFLQSRTLLLTPIHLLELLF